MIKNFTRIVFALILAVIISGIIPVHANTPYLGYTYDHWGVLVPSPAAYVPFMSIRAADIDPALGEFSNPMDMAIDKNGHIYILDTGNNRIVAFDRDFNLIRVIDSFTMPNGTTDTFNSPLGLFVTENLDVYVADTDNNRIVAIDANNVAIRIIEKPQGAVLPDNFTFIPQKVLVGRGDIVYVIARHVFEGIMTFGLDGEFLGYFGTMDVLHDPFEIIWRFFMTAEQRSRQRLFVPTEFLNMDIDDHGFIFTTNPDSDVAASFVMRLNPRGDDVLRNFTDFPIRGDLNWRTEGPLSGPSHFVDIIARPFGMYSALDATRGRVYTYDAEGNLLYVFSGTGAIAGMTTNPVALAALDENLLVLDSARGQILYFEPTRFGSLINSAVRYNYLNDEARAVEMWRELLTLDENFPLAFAGVGRAYLAEGDYSRAAEYLSRGMDIRHYSIAFTRLRNSFLQATLPYVFTGGTALFAVFAVYKIIKGVLTLRKKWRRA